jgi:DNA-binding transcriptional MerR regulator
MAHRRLRIGELARRTGLSADVLRAWERRYGLLRPARSEGGYRLYTEADEARVRSMQRYLDQGVPAGEAARLALEEEQVAGGNDFTAAAGELRDALDEFDESRSQAALDALLSGFSFEAIAAEVLLPYLRRLGERWERGDTTVAQEHFASNVLRGRLLALGRGWDRGAGPRALLACAPGELHDLGLLVFGLALRAHGWRITYLGPDTPLETLSAAAQALEPRAVVLVALTRDTARNLRAGIAPLPRRAGLYLAGAGVDERLAHEVGGELLPGDALAAAAALAGARSAAA